RQDPPADAGLGHRALGRRRRARRAARGLGARRGGAALARAVPRLRVRQCDPPARWHEPALLRRDARRGIRSRAAREGRVTTTGGETMPKEPKSKEPLPRFRHLDQEKWQQVRAIEVQGRRASVWEKWLDFTPGFLSLYAKWDPGMMIHRHGHESDH